jgi:hypothetical protein
MDNQQLVPSVPDLAYLAGILDADGSISLDRQAKTLYFHPNLAVHNTDYALIEWTRDLYRGLGAEPHVYERSRGKNKLIYTVNLKSLSKVKKALPYIIPFLHQKKQRAEWILEFVERRLEKTGGLSGRTVPYDSRDLELVALVYEANGDYGNNATTVREAAHRLKRQSGPEGNFGRDVSPPA